VVARLSSRIEKAGAHKSLRPDARQRDPGGRPDTAALLQGRPLEPV